MMAGTYTVVENSGYEGERDVKAGFKSGHAAAEWIAHNYTEDEWESMHVNIAYDGPAGRTYEH